MPYRFFSHTADAAVELEAPDEAGLRAAGVAALRELLVGDSPVAGTSERPIVPSGRDAADREVKAVTYHGLEVRRGEDGQLRANVVFDL